MTSLVADKVALATRLRPTDLRIDGGALVAVVGPNGGGKTSLLRALARVEHAEGSVSIGGEDLDPLDETRRRRLLAFLPASRDLNWPIAVRDVIALGLAERDTARIEELIMLFELEPLARRPIDRLSTGERARVLTARALAARPDVLLLDEPLSNLDPYWVLKTLKIMTAVSRAGQSVVVALHDLSLLHRFDRVLLIDGGEVGFDGPPGALVHDPLFERAFRLSAEALASSLNPLADRRSSP